MVFEPAHSNFCYYLPPTIVYLKDATLSQSSHTHIARSHHQQPLLDKDKNERVQGDVIEQWPLAIKISI